MQFAVLIKTVQYTVVSSIEDYTVFHYLNLEHPRGGTPILGHTGDVRPELVSFRGQKSPDECKFSPKNLRMGRNFNT